MGLVRFALKSAVAGGAVYYTVREGLWSKPEDTIRFYRNLYANVAPYVKENVPSELVSEIPEIPNPNEICNTVTTYWNKGVIASTEFLANSPAHMSNAVNNVSSLIQKQMQQTS